MVTAVRPIDDEPALTVRRATSAETAVVIADLHLGLGATPQAPWGPPGGSAPELAALVLRLCERQRARRLLVAGDVKHPVVGVPPWLRPVVFGFFATVLEAGIVPEVVLGNHDVGLVPCLPREVVVHSSEGAVRSRLGLFHGHRWPSHQVLAQRTVVAGHLHPGYRFAPTATNPLDKRRCWVRVTFDTDTPVVDRDGHASGVRELIVLPAFHPLAGTEALNRDRPERGRSFLYQRFLRRGRARAYLLDGTDLGPLPTPVEDGRGGASG